MKLNNEQIKVSTKTGLIIILSVIGIPILLGLLLGSRSVSEPTVGFTDSTSTKKAYVPNEIDSHTQAQVEESEYGTSLSECLEKADVWFAESKQITREVLEEEKTRKNPYQDFINQNSSSESEVMASLEAEWVNYKSECNKRF